MNDKIKYAKKAGKIRNGILFGGVALAGAGLVWVFSNFALDVSGGTPSYAGPNIFTWTGVAVMSTSIIFGIKKKHKKIEVIKLYNEKYYKPIGQIAAGWNLTEALVASIIWHVHKIKSPPVGVASS